MSKKVLTEDDHFFIGNMLAYFSNWQVFLFKGEKLLKKFCNTKLSCDLSAHLKNKALSECTSYDFIDENICYYAVVKNSTGGGEGSPSETYTYVIGPITTREIDRTECLRYLQYLGESRDFTDELFDYFAFSSKYTTDNFAQIFNAMHYLFGDTSNLFNTIVLNASLPEKKIQKDNLVRTLEKSGKKMPAWRPHISYEYENALFAYIEAGDAKGMDEFSNKYLMDGSVGQLSSSNLRHTKNIAIVTITLASRAAIRGGLSQETAYSMSDYYIQAIEDLNDLQSVTALQGQVLAVYCARVADEKYGLKGNKFAVSVKDYIMDNIDMRITTADIANSLSMNRTQLCNNFKRITGKTVAAFILELKVNEAKRLLHTTNKTLAEISYHLAFSSQSHFQNTFKRLTGVTPSNYREQNQ